MSLLGYVTVGTVDLARATAFYDVLLEPLGAKRIYAFDRGVFYGARGMEFCVLTPADGAEARPGNGTMAALNAATRALVDMTHARALAMGGSDEGSPGIRGREASGFYGAYFRDPDGNKLCVYRIGPARAQLRISSDLREVRAPHPAQENGCRAG
jgi:catechol 2,3-dioxygenase-like lactoylglutathione lyase family enzyme